MDYKRLDNIAKVEGRDALRERLNRVLGQAEKARERNKSGEISDGLSRGIRGSRYMLDRAVSAEKRPAGGNVNDKNKGQEVFRYRTSSTLPSPGNECQDQSAEDNSRIRKFGEGVEMLSPGSLGFVHYMNEDRRKASAYEVHGGRGVRRDKHGKPIISNTISYVAVAVDDHFRSVSPCLGPFDSISEVFSKCERIVFIDSNDRALKKRAEDRKRRSEGDDIDW